MEGILSFLVLDVIAPGLAVWLPVIMLIGYLLKHGTKFPNEFIAPMLFAVSAVLASLYGIGATAGMPTAGRVLTVILAYGFGQGFILTVTTVFVYDTIHGVAKFISRKRQEAEERKAAEDAAGVTDETNEDVEVIHVE